jgi:hypothetical protein
MERSNEQQNRLLEDQNDALADSVLLAYSAILKSKEAQVHNVGNRRKLEPAEQDAG